MTSITTGSSAMSDPSEKDILKAWRESRLVYQICESEEHAEKVASAVNYESFVAEVRYGRRCDVTHKKGTKQ